MLHKTFAADSLTRATFGFDKLHVRIIYSTEKMLSFVLPVALLDSGISSLTDLLA